jgi:hypothetical protein
MSDFMEWLDELVESERTAYRTLLGRILAVLQAQPDMVLSDDYPNRGDGELNELTRDIRAVLGKYPAQDRVSGVES